MIRRLGVWMSWVASRLWRRRRALNSLTLQVVLDGELAVRSLLLHAITLTLHLSSLVLASSVIEGTTRRLHGHAIVRLLLSLLLLLLREVAVARRVATSVQLLLIAQLLLLARLIALGLRSAHVLLSVLVQFSILTGWLHGLHSANLVLLLLLSLSVGIEPTALGHLIVTQRLLRSGLGASRSSILA